MINCRCCDSTSAEPYIIGYEMDNLAQQHHQYFKCMLCGAIFLDHTPAAKDYDESGYYQRKNVLLSPMIQLLMGFFHRSRYSYVKVNTQKSHSSNLLDIGCGKGIFLNVAKQDGWNVTGIEPTNRSAEYARNIHNINVIEAGLFESNIASNSFDVVTLWHVLEHLPEPSKVITEVERILAKGGVLVIAIPNIESIQAQFGGGKWFHLDPPRHIVHIPAKVLTKLLEKNGFHVEKIYHFSAEYNVLGWFQTLQNKLLECPNFTFNLLKRNTKALPGATGFILGCLSTFMLLLVMPLIIILSLSESLLRRGGTITVIARK